MAATTDQEKPLHKNEGIKVASDNLRGTILEGLADESTGAISDDDTQLTKFHGIYQQDDRDLRKERRQQKLEKAFSFMIRVRVPGGVCTPQQWLDVDTLASSYANETIKLTTRQAFQLHGVLKGNLKQTIKEINDSLMDTLAACGDVNRNVMCNPNPDQSKVHAEVLEVAKKISDHLSPQTGAYHEIWLDRERVTLEPEVVEEPIYGKTYLPRKFKTVIAVPPSNDVDIYAHDLGYIAIVENEKLIGFNVTVGGGMGMSHNKEATFPRLAQDLGFCTVEQVVDVAEKVVLVQRDHGDRRDRLHARLKYTIEDHGIDWFREQVEGRLGYKLEAPKPFKFENNGDRYGWAEGEKGHHFTLFIENGRVLDTADYKMREGLREIAKVHDGDFRLTANQNLIIANISSDNKAKITALLEKYSLDDSIHRSALRLNSMACVALPTCGLALAESQRYLPDLVSELEGVIEAAGLKHDAITIRMTGCPNGCARPYLAEIAMVGRAPKKYNLYLGGGFAGDRLNKLYRQSVKSDDLLGILQPMIEGYAKERESGERFGDYVIRKGIIKETTAGSNFHLNLGETKA